MHWGLAQGLGVACIGVWGGPLAHVGREMRVMVTTHCASGQMDEDEDDDPLRKRVRCAETMHIHTYIQTLAAAR